jgi:hypothetical protein
MRLIHDHCNFDCTLICLPSGASGLVTIAGIGRNTGQLTTRFRSGGVKKDIFQMIRDHKGDTFISDVKSPLYADLIPDWYKEVVGARSFAMLALVSQGKLLGIIYGDYSKQHDSVPTELEDNNMVKWRARLAHILQSSSYEQGSIHFLTMT